MPRDGTALLDAIIRARFGWAVRECARFEYDHIRAIWLHTHGTVPLIQREFRLAMRGK